MFISQYSPGRIIAVMFLAVSLIGCGGDSHPTTGADQGEAPAQATQETPGSQGERRRSAKRCTPPGPGEPWPTATPSEVQMDAERLKEAIDFAFQRQSGTFQVFRHGCLVGEGPLEDVFGDIKRNMFSHTKTVVALLAGRAITLGALQTGDTVGDYFPEADAEHAAITVRDLLTMTSGLRMEWVIELNMAQPSRVHTALNLPLDHEPGTYFAYAQTPTTLLSALIQRAVGYDLQDFAQNELFGLIGIERNEWFWLRDRAGHTEGWAWWFAEPNNSLARLGHLMLMEGMWNGERLIKNQYMRDLRTPTETNPGYGYLTWLNAGETYITTGATYRSVRNRRIIPSAPSDLYTSAGFHGQTSTVIPSLDMVVTRTHNPHDIGGPAQDEDLQPLLGADSGEGFYEIFRRLMRAVNDQDIPDPGPWDYSPDNRVEPNLYVRDLLLQLGVAGLGPEAPEDCNILGCYGNIAIEGTIESVMDIIETSQ